MSNRANSQPLGPIVYNVSYRIGLPGRAEWKLAYLVDWGRWLARHFVDGARGLDDGDNDQDDDAADNAVQANGGEAGIPSAARHLERIQWVSI